MLSHPSFAPFDFKVLEDNNFEVFLQQRVFLPVPMTPHITEAWIRDKRLSSQDKSFRYIGKVVTEPFSLGETQVHYKDNQFEIRLQFPWKASLVSEDFKHWRTVYE